MLWTIVLDMVIWTGGVGGQSYNQQSSPDSSVAGYQWLTNAVDYFELEPINCGEIIEKTPFYEILALNLTRYQQRMTVISGGALLQILTGINVVQDEEVIRALLNTYLSLNTKITEATLLISTRNSPEIIVHSAKRDNIANNQDFNPGGQLYVNTTTTTLENLPITGGSISDTKMHVYLMSLKNKGKPDLVWQQFCDADGKRQWRIVLILEQRRVHLQAWTTFLLYISLPLNAIDLNQCDDSPHSDLRGTHGCNKNLTSCVFTPGGGFRLGYYQCCCRNSSLLLSKSKSKSTTTCYNGSLVEQYRKTNKRFKWQCPNVINNNMLDSSSSNITNGVPDPLCNNGSYSKNQQVGRCTSSSMGMNVEPGNDIDVDNTLRKVLLSINVVCAIAAFVLIFVAMTHRRTQDWSARGWALMELFLLGAILLYCIVILEFLNPRGTTCCLITWCREFGFALFYGPVVLKIYRNLIEHRVRKAHHVFVKEKDLLKYLSCILAFTVTGLTAWTLTVVDINESSNKHSPLVSVGRTNEGVAYSVCTIFKWNFAWQGLELILLLYGCYLSYKARNTSWSERKQFSSAVLIEMFVSLIVNTIRYNLWLVSSLNVLLVLSFVQVHSTVTLIVSVILASKLYYASTDHSNRAHTLVSSGTSRAHPSLAKLRDNLVNGAIDFAEVPITEMNPDDIKAELKRVYTQLRMYKLTNLYVDNPHISKRKGGKKSSSKQTRRMSVPNLSSAAKSHKDQIKRCEADERSSLAKGNDDNEDTASGGSLTDLTVQSSMHNVYLSRTALAAAKKLQLDSDLSVRI